jgi:hypothetical protein
MAHRRPEPSVAFHTRCASGRRLSPLRSARRAVPTWDVRVNLYAGLPPVMSGSGGLTGSIIGHFSTMFSPGRPVLMAHMMLVATWVLTLVVATAWGTASPLVGALQGWLPSWSLGTRGSRSLCSATTTWTPASWPLGSS